MSLLYNFIGIRAELSISVEFCLAIRHFYLFYLFCVLYFLKQAMFWSPLCYFKTPYSVPRWSSVTLQL